MKKEETTKFKFLCGWWKEESRLNIADNEWAF